MSFRDLKKTGSKSLPKKQVSIEDFIEDANTYAQGDSAIVGPEVKSNMSLEQAIEATKLHIKNKKTQEKSTSTANTSTNKPFRHATFTLSEEAITQLNLLAKESKLAKSHILRILIDELCHVDSREKLSTLLDSKIP